MFKNTDETLCSSRRVRDVNRMVGCLKKLDTANHDLRCTTTKRLFRSGGKSDLTSDDLERSMTSITLNLTFFFTILWQFVCFGNH